VAQQVRDTQYSTVQYSTVLYCTLSLSVLYSIAVSALLLKESKEEEVVAQQVRTGKEYFTICIGPLHQYCTDAVATAHVTATVTASGANCD